MTWKSGFNLRVKNLPHKGVEGGFYTGEVEVEDGLTWFNVVGTDGREFQTQDEPVEIIDLKKSEFVFIGKGLALRTDAEEVMRKRGKK